MSIHISEKVGGMVRHIQKAVNAGDLPIHYSMEEEPVNSWLDSLLYELPWDVEEAKLMANYVLANYKDDISKMDAILATNGFRNFTGYMESLADGTNQFYE